MKNRNENKHMVDVLFVLTLFFVFALSMITLILLGINVYRKTVNQMGQNYIDRTSYAYITQKFREYDEASSTISISEFGDSDALVISSIVNDTVYNTYLYQYDGYICELLTRSDIEISPSAGSKIIGSDLFEVSLESKNLYKFTISAANEESIDLFISTKNGKAGGEINE